MASLVIKNLPDELHQRLKDAAVKNHRSMTGQAVAILEEGLGAKRPAGLPPLVEPPFPLTNDFINRAKREGRA